MKKLGVDMQLEEMLDLFDFINVQEQKAISIKEILVALTVGMVLDAIPSLVTQQRSGYNVDVSRRGVRPRGPTRTTTSIIMRRACYY